MPQTFLQRLFKNIGGTLLFDDHCQKHADADAGIDLYFVTDLP